jgi:hypothetical protein
MPPPRKYNPRALQFRLEIETKSFTLVPWGVILHRACYETVNDDRDDTPSKRPQRHERVSAKGTTR